MSVKSKDSCIKYDDLKAMLIKKIPENITPYQRDCMINNEKLMNDFLDIIKRHLKEDDTILCDKVILYFKIYFEGCESQKMFAIIDYMYCPPKEHIEWWSKIFDLPLSEMLEFGRSSLLYGHEILTLHYRKWLLETKYHQFFSDPDPETWFIKSQDIKTFESESSKYSPFDMNKYNEKMGTVMRLMPKI